MAQLEKNCAVKLGYDIVRAATGLGNTDIYSVTDIFVQKLSIVNFYGVFLVQNLGFLQLNIKGDQWNTVIPLGVPPTG